MFWLPAGRLVGRFWGRSGVESRFRVYPTYRIVRRRRGRRKPALTPRCGRRVTRNDQRSGAPSEPLDGRKSLFGQACHRTETRLGQLCHPRRIERNERKAGGTAWSHAYSINTEHRTNCAWGGIIDRLICEGRRRFFAPVSNEIGELNRKGRTCGWGCDRTCLGKSPPGRCFGRPRGGVSVAARKAGCKSIVQIHVPGTLIQPCTRFLQGAGACSPTQI